MANNKMTYSYHTGGDTCATNYMNSMDSSRNTYNTNQMHPMYGTGTMNHSDMYGNTTCHGGGASTNPDMNNMYNTGNTYDMYKMMPSNMDNIGNMPLNTGGIPINTNGIAMNTSGGMPMSTSGCNMPMNTSNMPMNTSNMPMNTSNIPMNTSSMPMNTSGMPMNTNGMSMNNTFSTNALTQPNAMSSNNNGEISVGGIVNIKYEIQNGKFYVSVNIADLIEVGSFTLDTNNPMINFTQGNSFVGYSLTFGIDYDKKEFYFSGYVKIPFINPFETGRFVIYSW